MMSYLKTFLFISLLIVCNGCIFGNPEVCKKALEMRHKANSAAPEERSMIKAKALGLEDACAEARQKRWEKESKQKMREKEYRESR